MDTGAFYMVIPIILGGERRGVVESRREGAYTVFEARCEARPGLLRLYLHGERKSAYLGLMCPQDGELRLRRRLSRAELREFPAEIICASDSPEPPEGPHRVFPAAPAANKAGTKDAAAKEAAAKEIAAAPEEWTERSDGSLVSGRLVALPCELRRSVPGVKLIERGGRTYMVFRY